ncbi:MAG: hypothetical protein IPQ23_22450 [Cytophagaceae bacterium]|nr:hypothetical protein [Cytophagaceae bacterium]
MADNASGFVGFEAFRGLNQDSEDKLMQEAIARAEAADAAAQGSLRKVSREAEGGYGPGGSFRDVQSDLTKVGSYSDYLKAKQNAANAWAAVSQSTGDPRTDALRGGRGAQAAEMGKASASALGADFTRRAGEASTRWSDTQKQRAEWKARDDKAAADRTASDEKTGPRTRRCLRLLATRRSGSRWTPVRLTQQFGPWLSQCSRWRRLAVEPAGQGCASVAWAWAPRIRTRQRLRRRAAGALRGLGTPTRWSRPAFAAAATT